EAELASIEREIQLGRDLAGVGDETVAKARGARAQLKAALDAEHKVLAGFASASHDRNKSQALVALADRATRGSDSPGQTEAQIDAAVDRGLAEVKTIIAQERANIVAYRKELADYDQEARAYGSTVLAGSFNNVRAKFYDIVIRTDVGNVDVLWSEKE